MAQLTRLEYEHQKSLCNGLCEIDHDRISADNPDLMPCVTCPFCSQLVDAILTKETISCPKCKVTVSR